MNSNGGGISLPEATEWRARHDGRWHHSSSVHLPAKSTHRPAADRSTSARRRGSVEAHTGAGDVTITLTGAGSHSVDVTSGKGQVVLVLPRDLSATLEIETAYTNNLGRKTRIESELPLTITETTDWDSSTGRRGGTCAGARLSAVGWDDSRADG